MPIGLLIQFIVLTVVISGIIIFIIHRTLISTTEGAVLRLNEEIKKANEKQMELNRKIKEADEELAKRQAEAKSLADKMRSDAENESKTEREKIISQARHEGEEIIAKAQGSKDKLRHDLEQEIDVKAIRFSMTILNDILSLKAKGTLDSVLINEFLESLKAVDMSKIPLDIKSAEIYTLSPLDNALKTQIQQLIKQKMNRDIAIENKVDSSLGGGVVLKFGSMALDGSIRSLIQESAVKLQGQVAPA